MRKIKQLFTTFVALIILCVCPLSVSARSFDDLTEGIYYIDAELSCYVNAMGGVEFGSPLLTSASVEIASNGSKTMTLYFTKSQVSIYGITCYTFIDVSPSYVTETEGIKSGTLGYYSADGTLVTDSIAYTLSNDTAENARKEQINYVESISFPIEYESNTYDLTLFVNSNVMGTQFTKDGHPAVLTVNWESLSFEKDDQTKTEEPIEETELVSRPQNVETKEGLNIYHTESDNDVISSQEPSESDTYIAHLQKPLLFTIGVVAGAFILIGVILIFIEKRRKKLE